MPFPIEGTASQFDNTIAIRKQKYFKIFISDSIFSIQFTFTTNYLLKLKNPTDYRFHNKQGESNTATQI